jgi:conjugal transfer pilus assembly protein TraE
MNNDKYSSRLANAFAQNSFYKISLLGSGAVNILLALVLIGAINSTRVIIVPPEIEKSFWVESDNVSKEYLEQMGIYISQLELNVTPSSQGYQSKQLLKYVHPSITGAMETKFLAEGEQLKKDNASTWFRPSMVRVDAKRKQVAITGEYSVTVAEKQVVKMIKTYLAEFEMSGNRLFLTKFDEAKDSELFKPVDEKAKPAAPVKPVT